MRSWLAKGVILLTAALLHGGCSSHYRLMPTPKVYALGIKEAFAASLPAQLKSADANIMYVTDRIAEPRKDGRLDYGLGRDHSQQIGEAVVNIGGDMGWEELAADARTGVRPRAASGLHIRPRVQRVHSISFQAVPGVASDLVLTVRYGHAPGAEHGRPLKHEAGFFWEIDDDYLESFRGDQD